MSARYSHHLLAEGAASSLETLIHDYERRGQQLAAVERALKLAKDEYPELAFALDDALAACGGNEALNGAMLDDSARAGLHEVGGSLWAVQPLLLGLPLFYAAYAGATAWCGFALDQQLPFDALEPYEHDEFGPMGSPRALARWAAALVTYLLLGPLVVCACACVQCRGCALRFGAARHDPLDVSRGAAARPRRASLPGRVWERRAGAPGRPEGRACCCGPHGTESLQRAAPASQQPRGAPARLREAAPSGGQRREPPSGTLPWPHRPMHPAPAGIAAVQLLLTLLLKPPFPEAVAWWLTVLPCMLAMGHLARGLLLVPRALRRGGAARRAAPHTPRDGARGGRAQWSAGTPRGLRSFDARLPAMM